MKLHDLKPASGSSKNPKRVGRGKGSGNGTTAGRGQNGQNSRSGGGVKPGFEGGQIPLYRRLPKRGFTNIFQTNYAIVNVETLNRFEDGTLVNLELLLEEGLVHKKESKHGIKVLGEGELDKKLTVQAKKFSKSAEEKILAAGGKVEVI